MAKNYFVYLILIQTLITVIQCFDIEENYFTNLNVMNGLVFPPEVDVTVDEDVFVEVLEPMENQRNCLYRKPGEKDIDVTKAKDNILAWDSKVCGIHIKGVKLTDDGYWRLTSSATADDDIARGIVLIRVKEKPKPATHVTTNVYSPSNYVSPKDTTYCYVLRPNQPKTEFPYHEKCEFPEIGKEVDANGIWHVVSGVKGKTEEVTYEVNVQAKVEQLKTSVNYSKSNSSLLLKCALSNTNKVLKFCRFLRMIDDIGFNMDEGHGTTKYRYFGNGFTKGECGLEVLDPDSNDKSTWKCYLGVDEDQNSFTLGALLDASDRPQKLSDGVTAEDVFGLHNSQVNILCKSKAASDYCWFMDPTGKKISVSDMVDVNEEDVFRYFGTGVKLGECGITIMAATINDSGTWSCHMGTIGEPGLEASKEINVRISESNMVSAQLFHEVRADAPLVIECTTVPPHLPVDYCRFILPDGTGLSVNEKSTLQNMVLSNYYFHPNRKMQLGHCSIVVRKATKKHSGQWTCASRLAGREHESWDDFRVHVLESELSTAAISGMILGAIFIVCASLAVAYFTYKRRYHEFDMRARNQPNRVSTVSSTSSESEMRRI